MSDAQYPVILRVNRRLAAQHDSKSHLTGSLQNIHSPSKIILNSILTYMNDNYCHIIKTIFFINGIID